jgi:hypothetical protein
VSGYEMAQELEVLRVKVQPFQPDRVILQYTINDEHSANYIHPRHEWLNRIVHGRVLLKHRASTSFRSSGYSTV